MLTPISHTPECSPSNSHTPVQMSCKSIIKEQLKKAPKRKLDIETLRPLVVASLVEAGKSKKKAGALFDEKLALPCFLVDSGVVRLSKGDKEEEAPAIEASAPPSKKQKSTDDAGKGKKKDSVAVASSSSSSVATGVTMMPVADAKVFWSENRMDVNGTGSDTFRPIANFTDAGFNAAVLSACASFSKPTPIQAMCWPVIMAGRDVIGVAETGSGKTLAFFLPAMMHCATVAPKGTKTPRVLVLAPTRELAMQSETVCKSAGLKMGLESICVYGGVPKPPQKQALANGAQVVVATPGRLLDLCQEGACSLGGTSYLVLDEADRMLDMGFEKDVRSIISMCATDRRTVMFTATWPESIRTLAAEFLKDPIRVNVGSENLSANHRVTQHVEVLEQPQKEARLPQLLQQYHSSRTNRVLVFALYKNEARLAHPAECRPLQPTSPYPTSTPHDLVRPTHPPHPRRRAWSRR